MPAATLNFSAPINVSCQVGDVVYYVSTTTSGGFDVNSGSVIEIGEIREIQNASSNNPTIIANTNLGYSELNGLTDKFILFSKNNVVNTSNVNSSPVTVAGSGGGNKGPGSEVTAALSRSMWFGVYY